MKNFQIIRKADNKVVYETNSSYDVEFKFRTTYSYYYDVQDVDGWKDVSVMHYEIKETEEVCITKDSIKKAREQTERTNKLIFG